MDSNAGHELIAAGLLILAGPFDGAAAPVDYAGESKNAQTRREPGSAGQAFPRVLAGVVEDPTPRSVSSGATGLYDRTDNCVRALTPRELAVPPAPGWNRRYHQTEEVWAS